MRKLPLGLLAIVALGLVITPHAVAACALNTQGEMWIPSGSSGPPQFWSNSLHGINAYRFNGVIPEVDFELTAMAGEDCVGTTCVPDFNVAFYPSSTTAFPSPIAVFSSPGPDSGIVPPGADFALIWMRHGPDVPNGDSDLLRAVFNFGQMC